MTILCSGVLLHDGGAQTIDELVTLMGQQEALCRRLLEMAAAERTMLAESRMDDLEHASREKAGIVEQMEKLEARRIRMVRVLACEMGMSESATLREVSAWFPAPQRATVEEARGRMGQVVAALKAANDGNLETMRRSLDLVRESMRNLRRIAGTGETYDSGGHSNWNAAGLLAVDRRA